MGKRENNCGMQFPPKIHPGTGRFFTSSGAQSIKESVYLILMTQKTERFTRPEFGSVIMSYPFTDPSPTRIHMMERELKEIILKQEPRVNEVFVQIEHRPNSPEMVVQVDYMIEDKEHGYVEVSI